ncbi:MAG: hypothetical protein WC975_08935 [Phycisphaerae bacterium]
MASEYYNQNEAMKRLALGKNDLMNLVRESKIREFRIEGESKYKKSEIDTLAMEINPSGGGGVSDASSTDAGSESAIDLMPADTGDGGTDVISLEETGEQSASMTPGKSSKPGKPGKKEDTVVTPAGVSVFDEDELAGMDADPMAKTQIAPSITDELSIEGGSGGKSGLLDMTRESDDTSLGAELLDEIYSGEETQPDKAPPEVGQADVFEHVDEPSAPVRRMVMQVEDPFAGLFTGLLVAAAILLAFSGLVAAGLVVGTLPAFIGWLSSKIFIWIIIAVVVVAAGLGVGYALDKKMAA